MKKLVCDLCGESDFVKVDGMFECQVCGAKYSVDQAKTLFRDVKDSHSASVTDEEEAPDSGYSENAVAQPKAGPTIVKKVIVAKPSTTQSADPQAAKRIVQQMKKQEEAPKKGAPTVVKKVVARPTVVAKPTAPVQKKPVAKPTIDPSHMAVGGNIQMIENLFILSENAYDSENYVDAENYANRVIEIDASN